ncbi:MAG: GNAT family N-acetyltransferase [Lachnospiraceae bacterium]|nr:GNAT family N-acetyltransferase [Lachnospiraceae bacterium]
MKSIIIRDNFEFRYINKEETDQAINLEQICFPPNEACSPKNMTIRIEKAAEQFLVAVDKKTGKIAGFLNGLTTNEKKFRDEFFTDADLYNKDGDTIMILGLVVHPDYRLNGLARELVKQYSIREKERGRKEALLTCLDDRVPMYLKFGFTDKGIADSTWGGEEWHEMSLMF